MDYQKFFKLQLCRPNRPAWAQYTIRVNSRDTLHLKLKNGIPTSIYYAIDFIFKCFRYLKYKQNDFLICEKVK